MSILRREFRLISAMDGGDDVVSISLSGLSPVGAGAYYNTKRVTTVNPDGLPPLVYRKTAAKKSAA